MAESTSGDSPVSSGVQAPPATVASLGASSGAGSSIDSSVLTGPVEAVDLASRNPVGTMVMSASGTRVRVRGTASDPDSSAPVSVRVSVDGRARVSVAADKAGHSYDVTIVTGYGRHTIGATAVNVGAGTADTVLGDRGVLLLDPATRNPRGTVHVSRSGRTVTVTGAVSDPDAPKSALVVRLYDNSRVVAAVRSNPRTHRFTARVTLGYGTSRLAVVALNAGLGTRNPVLARATITVARPWTDSYHGAQGVAARLFASHGWGQGQMAPLIALWNRESGWRVSAANSSGAYGIPQALPGVKMAAFGPNWQGDAETQIKWGLSYIHGRYGSPSAAWAHSQSSGWY